jgi:DNA-binding response OmpR family regulator
MRGFYGAALDPLHAVFTSRAILEPVNENKRVVVVDDEPSVQEVVRAYLEKDGYHVFVAGTGGEGLALAERIKPGLIVLDLMLPDISGEEIAREVRSRSDVPILMLTAKASEDERIAGLALGADDYLVKPFSPRELVARVRAILRRTQGAETPLVQTLSFDGGALEIDTVQHEVRRDGELVELTPNEYKLLVTLARYPGRVYSRFELINHVQGYEYEGYERTIDAHVKNLRKKIEADPKHPRYVETVFGTGYRLAKR